MTEKKIEIGKAINYGWESVKKDFWYLVGISALFMILTSISGDRDVVGRSAGLLGLVISAWLSAGYYQILLSYQKGKKLLVGDLFGGTKYFWRMLGAMLLLTLVVVLGLLLFIIPGVYLLLRYQFTMILIVDKDMSVLEAMSESAKMSEGVKLELFLFDLSLLGLVILGLIALVVGVFVTFPVIYLAQLEVYNHLLAKKSK